MILTVIVLIRGPVSRLSSSYLIFRPKYGPLNYCRPSGQSVAMSHTFITPRILLYRTVIRNLHHTTVTAECWKSGKHYEKWSSTISRHRLVDGWRWVVSAEKDSLRSLTKKLTGLKEFRTYFQIPSIIIRVWNVFDVLLSKHFSIVLKIPKIYLNKY